MSRRPYPLRRMLFNWVLLAIYFPALALATHITLEINTTTRLEGDEGISQISLMNSGDEPAAQLQIHVELRGQRFSSPTVPQLDAGTRHETEIRFPLTDMAPGRYHAIVRVDYTDLNGYPFTALSYSRVVYGEDKSPSVHVQLSDTVLARQTRMQLRLRNLDSVTLPLEIKLALPRELTCEQPERLLEIPGQREEQLLFEVRNFSALQGSRYTVFALVEYELAGTHSSTLVPARIEIVPPESFVRLYRTPLMVAFSILFVAAVAAEIWRRKSRHPKNEGPFTTE